ncbi:MAG: thioredoxin family protein [Verrucomicrobia bacterium]|nr:thioredoxin family protein [Verrucomicrobiota bacterium]
MKKFSLLAALLFASISLAQAELNWLTDYDAAKSQAKADNKLVLLDFTGSDWCVYCKQLKAEVFSKPQFADYAAKNLVLVELDFPRFKQQSDGVRKQNMQLAGEYNIEGFPTVIVLNSAGKQIGTLGYMPGGADAFIAALERLRKS